MVSDFIFGTGGAAGQIAPRRSPTSATGDTGIGRVPDHRQQLPERILPKDLHTSGSSSQFQLDLTTNVDAGGTPDQFTLAILDSVGAQIPTLSFFDVFVEIDIDSASPAIQTFASDPSQDTVAGGAPIDLAAPEYTTVTPAPEPSSIFLAVFGLAILAGGRAYRDLRRL